MIISVAVNWDFKSVGMQLYVISPFDKQCKPELVNTISFRFK